MKPCNHDSHADYDRLIEPLRDVARRLGYALAVHGTLVRDIDLIAVPWVDDAVPARTLARAIQGRAREIIGYAEPSPIEARARNPVWFRNGLSGYVDNVGQIFGKPHGRKCWTFHLRQTHDGPYIDLSVMPRYNPLVGRSAP